MEQSLTINEIQQAIADDFALLEEWMDKYSYLIELGNQLAPYDPSHKVEQNLIQGCQSRVWLNAEYRDGVVELSADSDAIITKGIVSLLVRVFSGQTPQAILDAEVTFIDQIGLRQNLSPTRANGLTSMLKQIKLYALVFNSMQK
ncbi:Fe-S metabolism protein SufE [Bacteroidia bacterium]|nr:Fe-S metabolism protein SufE [Bacteroidia bacterium]